MIHLAGKPCLICGRMEFIQETKDFIVCECCMSVYRDDSSLRLVSVGVYEKLKSKIEELTAALIKTNLTYCPERAGYETDYKYKKDNCYGISEKCNECWKVSILKGVII